jgi:hypothetical protein
MDPILARALLFSELLQYSATDIQVSSPPRSVKGIPTSIDLTELKGVYAAATKTAGTLIHANKGHVEWRVAGVLATGSFQPR